MCENRKLNGSEPFCSCFHDPASQARRGLGDVSQPTFLLAECAAGVGGDDQGGGLKPTMGSNAGVRYSEVGCAESARLRLGSSKSGARNSWNVGRGLLLSSTPD
jgi:hypothetical protein